MRELFTKWWNGGNKVFQIISYKDSWSKNGVGRQFNFSTNKAKKKLGDTCRSLTLDIGYLCINYTNYNL